MEKILYHHIRNKNQPRGRAVTLAMAVNENNEVTAWAAATCHPKDNFCKQTGRVKAAGRLNSPRHVQLPAVIRPVKDFLNDTVGNFLVAI